MEYEKLGDTDINVSKICVGCMSFGLRGSMHDWSLDEKTSDKMINYALDNGINFFDTANGYSKGTSEEYLGNSLRGNVDREDVVIASKVYFNPGRLSMDAINREIDLSLERLQTDYLDLYIIHRFDYNTPIEETMEALNGLVESGKVRSIGASAMYAYQFYNMQILAKDNGWAKFQAMENHYSLIYREDERDMIPVCEEMNVSLMPYSPLAAGHLTRPKWKSDTLRGRTDKVAMGKYDRMENYDIKIIERVKEVADSYACNMSEVALAWQWKKGVTSPIIGATKIEHFDEAINALSLKLTDDDIEYLEELYVAHPVVGAIKENPPEGVILLDEKK